MLFSTTTATDGWAHQWLDLTSWASQSITLTFRAHLVSGYRCPAAYLDEVSLGSAYPDLWVQKGSSGVARPGDVVVYTLAYGNRGAVTAAGAILTDTLPAEVTWITASVAPITTTPPLRWDLGEIAAGAGPFYIVVTTTLTTTVPLGSTFTNTAVIGGAGELESANNTATKVIFVGYRVYLPLVVR
jgi:uncharacterized repeat protein (TIGR01451 family)